MGWLCRELSASAQSMTVDEVMMSRAAGVGLGRSAEQAGGAGKHRMIEKGGNDTRGEIFLSKLNHLWEVLQEA